MTRASGRLGALVLLALAAAAGAETRPAQDKDKTPPKSPLALKLSVDKGRFAPGELVTFALSITNVSDKALTLDTRPGKHLNNGLDALRTGEFLRRVEGEGGKARLHPPALVSFAGIEPAVMVEKKAEPQLEPAQTVQLLFVAKLDAPKAGELRLLFDDPNSPGLKRFKDRLSRNAWSFPIADGKLTLRFVYDRGGIVAASNDVTFEAGAAPKP